MSDLAAVVIAFLAKYDRVEPAMVNAFVFKMNHGLPYAGENWGEELKAMREAVAALPSPPQKERRTPKTGDAFWPSVPGEYDRRDQGHCTLCPDVPGCCARPESLPPVDPSPPNVLPVGTADRRKHEEWCFRGFYWFSAEEGKPAKDMVDRRLTRPGGNQYSAPLRSPSPAGG